MRADQSGDRKYLAYELGYLERRIAEYEEKRDRTDEIAAKYREKLLVYRRSLVELEARRDNLIRNLEEWELGGDEKTI